MRNPPQLFLRFFRWFCHPKLLKYIEGDLRELYDERLKQIGKRKADLRFIIDVVLLFRPDIIRADFINKNINNFGMFKNYLRIGWRNIIRNKTFSFINISGLSLGLTCSILIALWVLDEYNMDAFHQNIDRIYAVTSCEYSGSEVNGGYYTPGLLSEEVKRQIPEVEFASGYAWNSFHTFAFGEKKMKLEGNYAGADFFKIFSYPLILGTKESALQSPESIAISRNMAVKLFGSPESAIGNSLLFENYKDLKVTAVFEDLDDHVSRKFEYLLNWDFFVQTHKWVEDWGNSGPTTFIMLREHAAAETAQLELKDFIAKYDKDYSDLRRLELGLQPYREKYLHSNFENGYISGGRIAYVQVFGFVAIFIMLIACINFMNLSTARAVKRAKEIGVRKVVGAVKTALVNQFMLEAFLFTAIAVFAAIILLQLALPRFNLLTGKNLPSPLNDLKFWAGIGILTLITGTISGSYPALFLSSFKPVSVLKSNLKISTSSGLLRKGLVIFQFALSIVFIIGMIVVSKQVDYIYTKNLGYQKNNLIYLRITGNIGTNFDVFKNETLQKEGIISLSHMSHRPVELDNSAFEVEWEGKPADLRPAFTPIEVGYDFVETMKAHFLYGRDFSQAFADSANYIINETALKTIGYKDPLGMPLSLWGIKGTIIGVVKDFHFNSLHVPIKPMILKLRRKRLWEHYALIRVQPEKMQVALSGLEDVHRELNPDFPFAHQFADEEYASMYKNESVIRQLSGYFAFLAIFISSLGLLGLVIFTAEQRTKEVGIRKILGASISNIVTLISKDFMKLVLISFILSVPVAYFGIREWLQGFEYHITVRWWVYAFAGISTALIAWVTLSFQAIKTALSNPVESLRSE